MKRLMKLEHEFVDFIPEELADGMLYVSIPFTTVTHRCCCGCGAEVVTPLSPTDWRLTFDGESISLSPSIGNWGAPCQSHYWIIENRVKWDVQWSPDQIAATRTADRIAKQRKYSRTKAPDATDRGNEPTSNSPELQLKQHVTVWRSIITWLGLNRRH